MGAAAGTAFVMVLAHLHLSRPGCDGRSARPPAGRPERPNERREAQIRHVAQQQQHRSPIPPAAVPCSSPGRSPNVAHKGDTVGTRPVQR